MENKSMTFCDLLEAFWHLLDVLGDPFWTPGRLLAHFGPGMEQIAIWLNFGRPRGLQFETFFVIVMIFWTCQKVPRPQNTFFGHLKAQKV